MKTEDLLKELLPPAVDLPDRSLSLSDEYEVFELLRSSEEPSLREAIVVRHLHLVPPIVRRYRGKAEWEDLVQVGYIGLVKAVDNFELGRNARFATYATHCIHGELRHYIRDRVDAIRRPRWLTTLSRQLASFIERHLHEKHRLPTFGEISAELNIDEEGVVELLRSKTPTYLEDPDSGLSVEKIKRKKYENFRLPVEDRIVLHQSLDRLKELERRIIYLFFYKDLTQRQIAGELDLPPKKVSRVMQKALGRLKEILNKEIF